MNSPLLHIWLEALHKQTQFTRKWMCVMTQHGTQIFCPLGILCNVSDTGYWQTIVKPEIVIEGAPPEGFPMTYVTPSNGTNIVTLYGTTQLPNTVQELVSFGTSVGTFKVEDIPTSLRNQITKYLLRQPELLSLADLTHILPLDQLADTITAVIEANPSSLYISIDNYATPRPVNELQLT